jgi:hypothetical protein
VEGDAFRGLVIEFDRALVSTGKQTLVVSRGGEVLERREPPLIGRDDSRSSVSLGEKRYQLGERALLEVDAQGSEIARTEIPLALFESHRGWFIDSFAEKTPEVAEHADHWIGMWWRSARLVADPGRARLLAIGASMPWLVAIRTDGGVDWVRLIGGFMDCCNSGGLVGGDGTFAFLSSCGRRITFLTSEGQTVSTHDTVEDAGYLLADGRGVAYVGHFHSGLAAYRPIVGLTSTFDIPYLEFAQLADGIIYAVIEDPPDGFVFKAFQEPT